MNWFPVLFCCCICLIMNRVHLLEGQAGVKYTLLCELWLKAAELCSNSGSDASKCVRTRSKNREAMSTGTGLAGEDFQNTGTFIVARSTVFAVSIAHKTHHARDAHNALWNSRRPGQVRKYSLASRGNWLFEDSRMCQ